VTQQIMKIAATATLDARAVLIIDSDAVLLREPTLDELSDDGRVRHFREDGAVTAGMERHLLWHNVARKLLGVGGTTSPPAPDYVGPICVWDPTVVRAMTEHLARVSGRDWVDAFAAELHVSEFVVYGVFVDHVLGGPDPIPDPLCHNYYERTPLSHDGGNAFAARMPSSALGAMISSHSGTSGEVRQESFRRCAKAINGGAPLASSRPPLPERAG
jgi:hypothetical protein